MSNFHSTKWEKSKITLIYWLKGKNTFLFYLKQKKIITITVFFQYRFHIHSFLTLSSWHFLLFKTSLCSLFEYESQENWNSTVVMYKYHVFHGTGQLILDIRKFFHNESVETLTKVAQSGGGCPISGNIQGLRNLVQLKMSLLIAGGWTRSPLLAPSRPKHSMIMWVLFAININLWPGKFLKSRNTKWWSICMCFKREGTLGEWWPLLCFHSLAINKCSLLKLQKFEFRFYHLLSNLRKIHRFQCLLQTMAIITA